MEEKFSKKWAFEKGAEAYAAAKTDGGIAADEFAFSIAGTAVEWELKESFAEAWNDSWVDDVIERRCRPAFPKTVRRSFGSWLLRWGSLIDSKTNGRKFRLNARGESRLLDEASTVFEFYEEALAGGSSLEGLSSTVSALSNGLFESSATAAGKSIGKYKKAACCLGALRLGGTTDEYRKRTIEEATTAFFALIDESGELERSIKSYWRPKRKGGEGYVEFETELSKRAEIFRKALVEHWKSFEEMSANDFFIEAINYEIGFRTDELKSAATERFAAVLAEEGKRRLSERMAASKNERKARAKI